MADKVMEFKNEYSVISNRLELLKLEKEIKDFKKSEAFKMLSLEQITEAHSYVEKGHRKGNIEITLDNI